MTYIFFRSQLSCFGFFRFNTNYMVKSAFILVFYYVLIHKNHGAERGWANESICWKHLGLTCSDVKATSLGTDDMPFSFTSGNILKRASSMAYMLEIDPPGGQTEMLQSQRRDAGVPVETKQNEQSKHPPIFEKALLVRNSMLFYPGNTQGNEWQ